VNCGKFGLSEKVAPQPARLAVPELNALRSDFVRI